MEYKINLLGGQSLSLSRVTEILECDNGLINVINDSTRDRFLNYAEFFDKIFSEKEGKIVKNVQIEEKDKTVVIIVEYFCYGKNGNGGYYWVEGADSFYVVRTDFDQSLLHHKVLEKMSEIKNSRDKIESEIFYIKNSVTMLNEQVKPTTESFVTSYLSSVPFNEDGVTLEVPIEKIREYINENMSYIRYFIEQNWKNKKVFDVFLYLELSLAMLGCCGAFVRLGYGDDSCLLRMVGVLIFLCSSLFITDAIKNNMISKLIEEIQNSEFADVSNPKTRSHRKNNKDNRNK